MFLRSLNNFLIKQSQFKSSTNFCSEFVKRIRARTDFSEPQIPYDEYKGLQQMQKSIKDYIQQGNLKDALEISQIYSEKISKHYGDTHPAYFSSLNNTGLILKMTGKYSEAQEMYSFVFTGYKELFGEQHNSTLTIRLNQANLYIQQGMYQSALEILKTVLSYRIGQHFQEIKGNDFDEEEANSISYDDIHLDNIESIENNNIPLALIPMSNCYRELKDYDKSIETSKKCLNLLYTKYSEDNVVTATVYNNMGLTYKKAKEFNQAEENYKIALDIRLNYLPPDHPDVLASRHNLGELYLVMGEDEKGQAYLNANLQHMKPK